MNNGIILAGNMIVDALKDIDIYPEHSNLTTIRRVTKALGGLLCNCALDLAAIDGNLPIHAVGVVGDDDYGRYITDTLKRYKNIDLSSVRIGGETSFTDAMCDTTNRTRTFFTYRGASSTLCPEDFDFEKIKGSILHIGYILLLDSLDDPDIEYGTKMARVLARAQSYGIKTSIDVVSEESNRYKEIVAPSLKYTDYCIINETEASKISGISVKDKEGAFLEDKIPEICAKLRESGVGEWVVIHSRDASYGMDKDGSFIRVPSINIPGSMIKGTTGAGDAFASGVLYGAYRDMSMSEAMRVGTAVASSSILTPGASDSIMPYDKTMKFYEEYLGKYGEVK